MSKAMNVGWTCAAVDGFGSFNQLKTSLTSSLCFTIDFIQFYFHIRNSIVVR